MRIDTNSLVSYADVAALYGVSERTAIRWIVDAVQRGAVERIELGPKCVRFRRAQVLRALGRSGLVRGVE